MTLPFVEPPVKSTPDPVTDTELIDLRHRVEILEACVRMAEGQVTGPLFALPTLGEAALRVSR